jgi:hypothetical protein
MIFRGWCLTGGSDSPNVENEHDEEKGFTRVVSFPELVTWGSDAATD